ncbi:hypothetical protein [Pseudomonas sp.]|uniref:hypothetical protein n=1 Tax=Pseudomonas sp. TaxID=306 RepID=UPI00272EF0DA|nr:hypothetical protein [Pseudomonas sp.]MDP2446586.1 hypothetical protein [Pseudomonas sp.]MDZ4334272.1 hypothetical protein [Pseudomonas sp.]
MSTLEQQRKAINEGMLAKRGTGAQMEAERQALGQAMVARRTGASQLQDINDLVRPVPQQRTLRRVEPRGSLPPQKGRGTYSPPPVVPSGGAGIASPLVEQDYAARLYWDERTVVSVDGLLSFRIKPIKEFTQLDANDLEVKQQFAAPIDPEPPTP